MKFVFQVLEANHTHEVSNKAQEVLRRIGLGLQNNSSLLLDDLLVYIYHTLKDLQPFLKDKETKEVGYVPKSTLSICGMVFSVTDIYPFASENASYYAIRIL